MVKEHLVVKAALTTALISCAIAEKKPEKDKMGYYIECDFLSSYGGFFGLFSFISNILKFGITDRKEHDK